MPKQPLRSVGRIVSRPGGALAPLLRRATPLAALDQALARFLGAPLDGHCRLANLLPAPGAMAHTAVLQAESPVWAARLRFQAPAIAEWLRREHGMPRLRSVHVRVRPGAQGPDTRPARPARMTPTAADGIRSAASGVKGEALKAALLRLARNGR